MAKAISSLRWKAVTKKKISEQMKKLRIHYLQHVPYEDLGCIQDWCTAKRHSVAATKFYEEETLPEMASFDWLIILGGPMSVNDSDKFSWIDKEKQFIEKVIKAGKTIIGICLGSQFIASVSGSKIDANPEKEIGWFPILKAGESNLLFSNSQEYTVFHWHGETFELPKEAKLLASSEACTNQAFMIGDRILGLQFHLEVTEDSLAKMVTFGKSELTSGKYIQQEENILKRNDFLAANTKKMYEILNYFESR